MATTSRKPAQSASGERELDRVHARVLQLFPELVTTLGGDPEQLLHEIAPARARSAQATGELSFRQKIQLMDRAALRLGCPDFGLRLASLQNGSGMFGPVGEAMRNCATYAEALRFAQEHVYAHSLAVKMWSSDVPGENAIFAGHEILLNGIPDGRQFMEQTLLAGCLSAASLTDGRTRARRVLFRHEPLSPQRSYHRHFGCDVLFDQPHYGVVFACRDLQFPIVARDEDRLSRAVRFIESHFDVRRPPLHAEVRGAILHRLGMHDCSNETIADALNMHSRTLHRRLRSEGTSFQEIKDQVRKDLLLYFLHQTDIGLLDLAERLDFSEQSVMSRYCRRWFEASPSTIRKYGLQRGP